MIGKLRHRVAIVGPSLPRDKNEYGEENDNTGVGVERWAEVETLTGRELLAAQQIIADATHRVRLRWLPHPDLKGSILFDGAELVIEAVRDADNRKRFVDVYCRGTK